MTDPVVEAAQRSWIKPRGRWALKHFNPDNRLEQSLTDAAREALVPIREKSEELDAMFGGVATDVAAGVRLVLAQIRPLIYTTEELNEK